MVNVCEGKFVFFSFKKANTILIILTFFSKVPAINKHPFRFKVFTKKNQRLGGFFAGRGGGEGNMKHLSAYSNKLPSCEWNATIMK